MQKNCNQKEIINLGRKHIDHYLLQKKVINKFMITKYSLCSKL